ncbi:pancreatic polypeptide receptor [Branchiostoma belcheri]|nr:pancreatic polypeptide receptor [Branchiostoma belcheri]
MSESRYGVVRCPQFITSIQLRDASGRRPDKVKFPSVTRILLVYFDISKRQAMGRLAESGVKTCGIMENVSCVVESGWKTCIMENVSNVSQPMTADELYEDFAPNMTGCFLLYEDLLPNTTGCFPPQDSDGEVLWAKIFLCTVYSITMLTCGVGNLLLMVVIAKYKEMRTLTNALVANLALSDFLVAVFCVPFILDYHIVRPNRLWTYGDVTCAVVNYARMSSLYVSTNALLVIAVDRYVVIMMPHIPRMSRAVATCVVMAVWVCSMLLAIPTAVYSRALYYVDFHGTFCGLVWPIGHQVRYKAYYLAVLLLEFIVPVLIMSFCYIRIARRIWYRTVPGQQTESQQAAMLKSKKRNVRLLIVILVMFVLCWGPYYGYAVVRDFFPRLLAKSRLNITLHYIVEAVAMGNSSIDTVVYIAMNGNVRKFMKKLPHDCYTSYMQWKNRRVQPVGPSGAGGRRPAARRSSTRSDNTFPPSNYSNYRTRDVKEVFCIEDRVAQRS